MGGSFHGHSFTSFLFKCSPRPPRFAFHLLCLSQFVPLIPVAILLFLLYFFSFSLTFSWLAVFTRIPVSPRQLRPPASPRFYPLQAQHWYTNTRSRYLLFTYFTLKRSEFRMYLLLHNSLTTTGCPTRMTFYPSHPPPPHPTLPFSPTTGTVLGFEYPFKILTNHQSTNLLVQVL